MSNVDNIIIEQLRAIRNDIAESSRKQELNAEELRSRVSSLEGHFANLNKDVALLHADFAGQSVRLDRHHTELNRISARLGIIGEA